MNFVVLQVPRYRWVRNRLVVHQLEPNSLLISNRHEGKAVQVRQIQRNLFGAIWFSIVLRVKIGDERIPTGHTNCAANQFVFSPALVVEEFGIPNDVPVTVQQINDPRRTAALFCKQHVLGWLPVGQ